MSIYSRLVSLADPCETPDLCQNGGTCANTGMGYASCRCPQYWAGDICGDPGINLKLSRKGANKTKQAKPNKPKTH